VGKEERGAWRWCRPTRKTRQWDAEERGLSGFPRICEEWFLRGPLRVHPRPIGPLPTGCPRPLPRGPSRLQPDETGCTILARMITGQGLNTLASPVPPTVDARCPTPIRANGCSAERQGGGTAAGSFSMTTASRPSSFLCAGRADDAAWDPVSGVSGRDCRTPSGSLWNGGPAAVNPPEQRSERDGPWSVGGRPWLVASGCGLSPWTAKCWPPEA
jgi:hypothetical protein